MYTTLESVNQFIDWTQWKMALNQSPVASFPRKKEIWWASLGHNIGVEVNGKNHRFERPILVLKVFNTEAMFTVALTSQVKESKYSYSFIDSNGIKSSVNMSQLRTISTKRVLRKLGEISDSDFEKVVGLIWELVLKAETPALGVSSELPNG